MQTRSGEVNRVASHPHFGSFFFPFFSFFFQVNGFFFGSWIIKFIDYFKMAKWGLNYVGFCQSIYLDFFNLESIHFFKGEFSLEESRGGSLTFCLPKKGGQHKFDTTKRWVTINVTASCGRVTFFNTKYKGRAGRFYIHAHRDSSSPTPLLKNGCSLKTSPPPPLKSS